MSAIRHLLRVATSLKAVGSLLADTSLRAPRRHSRRRSQREAIAAQLERLEDRVLLTFYVVTNTNNAGGGSLRAAINNANNNGGLDFIRFDSALTGQSIKLLSSLPVIDDSIDIRGPANSKDAIIIDGQGRASLRPVTISTAPTVTLMNLTITGGKLGSGQVGGGLYNGGPDTQLVNVRVTGNQAQDGGGIFNDTSGVLSITNSEISNNQSTRLGGGLYARGLVGMDGSQILGNSASVNGGGIFAESGIVSLSTSTIASNTAVLFGGGVHNGSSILIGSRLLLSNNQSDNRGGGHYDGASATSAYTNSTFVGNAGLAGGGLYSEGALTLVNCTVVNNTAIVSSPSYNAGGGVRSDGGTLIVVNTVIALNTSPIPSQRDIDPNEIDFESGNFIGTVRGNPRLGPLQDNGGPTLSMMPYADSPLIDTGDSARATTNGQLGGSTPLVGDQRGFSRFVDGNLNNDVTVDVGAVEYNPGPDVPIVTGADVGQQPRITVYNQDGSVRWSRFAFAASFTGGVRVAVGDVDGDGTQDVIAAQGPGGQSTFRVFDGVTGELLYGRSPFGTSYTGGLHVASADFNNDGKDDIVASTSGGGVSRVRVRNAANPNQNLRNIRVGSTTDMAEVRVAVGDVNNDGKPDIVATLGPKVKVFNGSVNVLLPPVLHEFTPFGANYNGLLSVATGKLNGDSKADIIVGRGVGGPFRIKLYAGNTGGAGGQPSFLQEIVASDPAFSTGVRVAARDIDGDGLAEIITASGPGGDPIVRTYWSATGFTTFNAFTDEFLTGTNGLFVAVG